MAYACWRSTEYALGQEALNGTGPASGISKFYPIASMALGYYFITLHTSPRVARGAVEVAADGAGGLRRAATGLLAAR